MTNFSYCNYVVGSCNTTCNYGVIFSIKFQLRCRLFWHNLQLCCYLLFQNDSLKTTCNYVVSSCDAKSGSGGIKPQCQLAAEDEWSIETHLLTKQCYFSDSTKSLRWKWAVTVVKRETPKFWYPFLGCFSWKNTRFATVPYPFFEKRAFTSTVSGPAGYLCRYVIIEGSLEVKLLTLWTDEKQRW